MHISFFNAVSRDNINNQIICRRVKMIYGYARVSKTCQDLISQIDLLKDAGCEKIFKDKMTGARSDRPALLRMLEILKPGDIIIVFQLTRLGRSVRDLISLSESFLKMHVELKSLKENIDTTTSSGKAMFGMLAVMAEFERDLASERIRAGIKAARSRGRLGGRPPKNEKEIERATALYKTQIYTVKEISEMTGISRTTIYKYLKGKNEDESIQ